MLLILYFLENSRLYAYLLIGYKIWNNLNNVAFSFWFHQILIYLLFNQIGYTEYGFLA